MFNDMFNMFGSGVVGGAPISISRTAFSNPTTGVTYTVPSNAQWLYVKAWGAGGGGVQGGYNRNGGAGGFMKALIPVTPSETLQVRVGGGGLRSNSTTSSSAGINGGGNGGARTNNNRAAGGGGYSGLFRSSTALLIAGGGGGAGDIFFSSNVQSFAGSARFPQATDAAAHQTRANMQGRGGSQTSNGSGGIGTNNGSSGSSLQGGAGASFSGSNVVAAGGGGGGWRGGGGGGSHSSDGTAGGGGGSSYSDTANNEQVYYSNAGDFNAIDPLAASDIDYLNNETSARQATAVGGKENQNNPKHGGNGLIVIYAYVNKPAIQFLP
jgi:hypothetical protein